MTVIAVLTCIYVHNTVKNTVSIGIAHEILSNRRVHTLDAIHGATGTYFAKSLKSLKVIRNDTLE